MLLRRLWFFVSFMRTRPGAWRVWWRLSGVLVRRGE